MMGKRREAEFRLTPSFHCYMFKSRFHGQLIFPLHERPCLPLNGAHVAQKHFNLWRDNLDGKRDDQDDEFGGRDLVKMACEPVSCKDYFSSLTLRDSGPVFWIVAERQSG
jgi:hypothetical protein